MKSAAAVAASLVAALLVGFPATQAGQTFTANGHSVAFADVSGNEWWVQAHLSGTGASTVAKVEAQQTASTSWVDLPKQSYGDWAASVHVVSGNQVRFRATWGDGTQIVSCWFTHPAGAEACSTAPPPPPPPSFAADFTGVRGNEWWVQANVAATGGTLAGVDARVYGAAWSAWQPLAHQSWGGWAASFHVPQGSLVQLRATASSGAAATSGCYQWIPASNTDAPQTACPGGSPPTPPPPPPPPSSPPVFYDHLVGNEWWIQAQAHSKSPIAGVDARVDGGTWVAMTLHDYGWAVSTRAPSGSHVQLRARFPDGTYAFLPNGYVWTAATQWPPPSSTFDARFENVKGNPGWVQVNVYASAAWGLSGVSYRVDSGAWQPLARQTYGDWTAAASVPDGSYVQFRAESGQTLTSGPFVWPSARAVATWPVEGSHVRYSLEQGEGDPGGSYWTETQADLAYTFTSGRWVGTCRGHTDETYSNGTTSHADWTSTIDTFPPPPASRTDLQVNDTLLVYPVQPSGYAHDCERREEDQRITNVTRVATGLQDSTGRALQLPAFTSVQVEECGCYSTYVDWDARLGLLLDWHHEGMSAGYQGRLVETDAPIG